MFNMQKPTTTSRHTRATLAGDMIQGHLIPFPVTISDSLSTNSSDSEDRGGEDPKLDVERFMLDREVRHLQVHIRRVEKALRSSNKQLQAFRERADNEHGGKYSFQWKYYENKHLMESYEKGARRQKLRAKKALAELELAEYDMGQLNLNVDKEDLQLQIKERDEKIAHLQALVNFT